MSALDHPYGVLVTLLCFCDLSVRLMLEYIVAWGTNRAVQKAHQ